MGVDHRRQCSPDFGVRKIGSENVMDLSRVHWRKSSRSTPRGQCVEVCDDQSGVRPVRDSKDPASAPLLFASDRFGTFLDELKDGRFDR